MENIDQLHIGSWVSLKLSTAAIPIVGTVHYIGNTDFAEGTWLGLILIPECRKYAKNNGIVQGKRYFDLPTDELVGDGVNSNFGLFVRPKTIRVLTVKDLITSSDISQNSKIGLISTYIHLLKSQLLEYSAKLEMAHVEQECSSVEMESLKQKFSELTIEHNALKSLSDKAQEEAVESDMILQNKKLQFKLAQIEEEFHQREYEYLETIDLLKQDFKNLESKIKSGDAVLNEKIISDLTSSELIIEKLTTENSDLLTNIDEMTSKITELERLLNLNKDLNACYEQTEKELNETIVELKQIIVDKESTLEIYKKSLSEANGLISSHEKLKEMQNKNKVELQGLYQRILLAFTTSKEAFSNFLLRNIINSEWKQILNLIESLYKLKYISTDILTFCDSKSVEYNGWNNLVLKLDFMLNLVIYDNKNVFLCYLDYIEKINTFILNTIKLNNETEDASLILTMSLKLPLDIDSFIQDNTSFENVLINRELLIYYLSVSKNTDSKLFKQLEECRKDRKGIQLDDINSVIKSIDDFDGFIEIVDSKSKPFWELDVKKQEIKVESTSVSSTNEIQEELELKIQILQSKLSDEKKVQQNIADLERKSRQHDENEKTLTLKLQEAKGNETMLTNEVQRLRKTFQKYGIKESTGSSIADDFEILEKSTLLSTIEKQRSLISELSELSNTKNDSIERMKQEWKALDQPARSVKFVSAVPSIYYRRLDSLFDNCMIPISNSSHNHSYHYQKLLEYLNIA